MKQNLYWKYTGNFNVSLIFVANLAFCIETSSHEIYQKQLGQQLFSQEQNLKKEKDRDSTRLMSMF